VILSDGAEDEADVTDELKTEELYKVLVKSRKEFEVDIPEKRRK